LLYKRGDVAAHFVYLKFFEGATRNNADDSSWFGIDGQLQISEATRAAATFYYWLDQEHKGTLGFTPYQYWIATEVTSRLTSGLVQSRSKAMPSTITVRLFWSTPGDEQRCERQSVWRCVAELWHGGLTVAVHYGGAGSKLQLEGGSKDTKNIGAWLGYFNRMYQGPEIISLGPIIDVGDGFSSKWGTGNGFYNGIITVVCSSLRAAPSRCCERQSPCRWRL